MRRFGVVTASLMIALGSIGLTGCNMARAPARDTAGAAVATGAEEQALVAFGFEPLDLLTVGAIDPAQPSGEPDDEASPGATPGDRAKRDAGDRKRHPARGFLRKNLLHGEIVVQTDDGTRTIAVQRGTVTEIDDDSMTVKSTDGFTLTWTFGERLRVVERRTTVQPDDIKAGTEVGVAGAKDGGAATARLIVIPRAK
jgi:hypothetical protein